MQTINSAILSALRTLNLSMLLCFVPGITSERSAVAQAACKVAASDVQLWAAVGDAVARDNFTVNEAVTAVLDGKTIHVMRSGEQADLCATSNGTRWSGGKAQLIDVFVTVPGVAASMPGCDPRIRVRVSVPYERGCMPDDDSALWTVLHALACVTSEVERRAERVQFDYIVRGVGFYRAVSASSVISGGDDGLTHGLPIVSVTNEYGHTVTYGQAY